MPSVADIYLMMRVRTDKNQVRREVDDTARAAASSSSMKQAGDKAGKDFGQSFGQSAQKEIDKWTKNLSKTAGKAQSAGPWWLSLLGLAPAASAVTGVAGGAAIGLGGAAVAGGGALAAYGVVAKGVLSDAAAAAKKVEAAQAKYNATVAAGVPKAQAQLALQQANARAQLTYNQAIAGGANPAKALAAYHQTLARNQATYNAAVNTGAFNAKAYAQQQQAIRAAYAGMSQQQITLSKQLGGIADSWKNIKDQLTPLVAGSLQPWLQSVVPLMKSLVPIVQATAPVIRNLGVEFSNLINSDAFKHFRDFIAGTGSLAVGGFGSAILGFFQAFMIILPQFNPLIGKTVGFLYNLGPALVKWASSKSTADHIIHFMDWFNKNGPAVWGLLKNLGGALKALTPGLTAGGLTEVTLLSQFLGFVAKLPPSFAKPITEVALALLTLNKLGVLKVGIQVVGAAAKWITGGILNLGGGAAAGVEIRTAMVSGGAAAAAEIRAAFTGSIPVRGATGAVGGAEAGGAAGLGSSLLGKVNLAAAGAAIAAGLVIRFRQDVQHGFGAVAADIPKFLGGTTGLLTASASGWANAITTHFRPTILHFWDSLGHDAKSAWDSIFGGGGKAADQAKARIATAGEIMATSWKRVWDQNTQRMRLATGIINGQFDAQGRAAQKAKGDLDKYTLAVSHNAVTTQVVRQARANLIADLVKAGVNAKTAQGDVDNYTQAIRGHGAASDQARAARLRLIQDIFNANHNAQQGRTDVQNLLNAITRHGTASDQARGARLRLIQDLVKSGLSAQDAKKLVDGLQRSIDVLHGKLVNIIMTGAGSFKIVQSGGTFSFSSTSAGGKVNAFPVKAAAQGLYIAQGRRGVDDQLILAQRDELVVPPHLVRSGAVDHLRGLIPGFASGGLVGGAQPSAKALPGYVGYMWNTFQSASESRMVGAMQAAVQNVAHQAAKAFAAMAAQVPNVGSGTARWAGVVRQALSMLGLSQALLPNVLYQMQTESGGNPNAINLWDINAQRGDPSRGLMQVIMSTFRAYHVPGTSSNIYDPLANVAAALNYGDSRYGPALMTAGGMGIGSGHGYADGGWIKEPVLGIGMRTGTPITLAERGDEYVMNGDLGRQIVAELRRNTAAIEATPGRTAGGLARAINGARGLEIENARRGAR